MDTRPTGNHEPSIGGPHGSIGTSPRPRCGITAEGRETMSVQELKRRVADGYEVDPRLVAEALLRRNGLQAIAGAIAGQPPLNDGARSRAAGATHPAGGLGRRRS